MTPVREDLGKPCLAPQEQTQQGKKSLLLQGYPYIRVMNALKTLKSTVQPKN